MNSREVWHAVYAACVRRGAKDREIAVAMNVSDRTLLRRKDDPDSITFGELVSLMNYFGIPMSELTRGAR